MLSSVLCPDPDGPITAQNCPAAAAGRCRAAPFRRQADVERFWYTARSATTAFAGPASSATDRHQEVELRAARSAGVKAAMTGHRRQQQRRGEQPGSVVSGNSGVPSALRTFAIHTSSAPAPSAEPAIEPARPRRPPWSRNTRRIWPREMPIARRMPISAPLHHHHEHAGDAERHRQADEEADRGVRRLLRVDRGEELRIGPDPVVGVDAHRRRAQPLRHVLRGVDVGQRHVDARDTAGQSGAGFARCRAT